MSRRCARRLGAEDCRKTGRITVVSLDARRTVQLRGVDGRLLSSIGQVPSALQAWTYVLHPGPHTLWVSSVPAGLPFVPQRLSRRRPLRLLLRHRGQPLRHAGAGCGREASASPGAK